MRLKTIAAFRNKTLKIHDGIDIKFDNLGICEVKDKKLAEEILAKYPEFIFTEDHDENKKIDKLEREITQEFVNELNSEIYTLKQTIMEHKDARKSLEADLRVWKDKVGESEAGRISAENALAKEKESKAAYIETLEFKVSLMSSTATVLKTLCADSNFPKDEWDKLTKEQLIEYILTKN